MKPRQEQRRPEAQVTDIRENPDCIRLFFENVLQNAHGNIPNFSPKGFQRGNLNVPQTWRFRAGQRPENRILRTKAKKIHRFGNIGIVQEDRQIVPSQYGINNTERFTPKVPSLPRLASDFPTSGMRRTNRNELADYIYL